MNSILRSAARFTAFGLALVAGHAGAQSYPVKPVRIVVPTSPGGRQ